MLSVKDWQTRYKKYSSKRWLKVKRRFKKIAHTKLRRGEMDKYYFRGMDIWD